MYFCSFPVPLSFAETLTMPFASISKVTSIWGVPLAAGGIPTNSKFPKSCYQLPFLFHPVNSYWNSGLVIFSSGKYLAFFVGIVVFLSISFVIHHLRSQYLMKVASHLKVKHLLRLLQSTPAWIAAPIATTSSGLLLLGSFPKIFLSL